MLDDQGVDFFDMLVNDQQLELDQIIDSETAAVMKERVATSTRGGYDSRNITFMIWLFDGGVKYAHMLQPNIIDRMNEAHSLDKAVMTKKGRRSKKREHLRAVCRAALISINPSDTDTLPLNLERLSFQIFTRFLYTYKKKVQRRGGTAGQSQSACNNNNNNNKDDGDEESLVDEEEHTELPPVEGKLIRLSPSSYDGACSALAHLFTESGIGKDSNDTTRELWTKLSFYKKGTRRLRVKEKSELGLSMIEGKRPLSFAAYKFLAQVLFESNKPEHVAAHTFLILQWNLIARAEYVVEAKIDSIWSQQDSIMFDIGKTKTDQEGTRNIDHPWHLYSNNECPYICPTLALARHLINDPNILAGQRALFEGSGQYDRYNKILFDIVSGDEYRDKFVSLGMPPEYFGTHSLRKGAVTHISTGTTSCPPISSICLRANWSMPGVLNRYIKYENAGDQFVGRCVAGLSRLSKEFAASPAYFDFSTCTRAEKEHNEKLIDSWIKDRMPAAARNNDKVFALFKMCIASLGYHRHLLEKNLGSGSNIRASIFFLEKTPLLDFITVKYPWNKTSETPEITGIPPDVLILAKFESLTQQLEEMRLSMEANYEIVLRRELDSREVGGSDHRRMSELMNKMDNVLETLATHSTIPEIDPGSGDNNIHAEFDLYDDEEDVVLPFPDVDEGTANEAIRVQTKRQLSERKYTIGYHHGKMNPLPSTWKYPRGITLIHLINLWLIGDKEQNVPPLGMVSTQWVRHFDKKARNYSKMKQVMAFVETFGRQRGVWLQSNTRWDGRAITILWSSIWEDLSPYMSTKTITSLSNLSLQQDQLASNAISYHKSRNGQVAVCSIYNKLVADGKLAGNKPRKRQRLN